MAEEIGRFVKKPLKQMTRNEYYQEMDQIAERLRPG
jgi:hypothetical protein